jgi:hypothetical protein
MNGQLIAAGFLAVLAAAIHGGAGELLVMRRLSPETLAGTAFGGPRMTWAMIHVTWHVTTVAFLAVGIALLLSGSVLEGDAARAVGLVAAGTSTGFAAVAVGVGAAGTRTPRSLLRHPGPIALAAVAALAWWGALLLPQ